MYSVIRHSRAEFEPKEFIFSNDHDEANCCNVEQTFTLFGVTSFNLKEPI